MFDTIGANIAFKVLGLICLIILFLGISVLVLLSAICLFVCYIKTDENNKKSLWLFGNKIK